MVKFVGTVDGDLSTEDCEGSGDFQMITEIWIEPQYGHVGMLTRRASEFMHSLQYHQLPDAVSVGLEINITFFYFSFYYLTRTHARTHPPS